MTFDEFTDPAYHEDSGRKPMAELIEELREAKGQPRFEVRPAYDGSRERPPRHHGLRL